MALSIRDAKVCALANALAHLRGTSATEAIAQALKAELEREADRQRLVERLKKLADETLAMAGANPREVTKEEIDDLWGQ